MNSVLLTIDLTKAVADEAIERKDCVVVSYRTLLHRPRSQTTTLTGNRPHHIQGFQGSYSGRHPATVLAAARTRGHKRTAGLVRHHQQAITDTSALGL